MKNNVVLFNEELVSKVSSNNKMDEIFMSQIIDEPDWHREGIGKGLLAENKSWGE